MLGYVFHFSKFPSDSFWDGIEKLSYFVLAPALLINRLSSAKLSYEMLSSTVVALYVLLVCMVFLCIVIQAIFKQEKSSFTSIVQGSMRFNLYNLLATVAVFYGDDALTTMAVIIGFYIPLINIICVVMFAVYLKSTAFSLIKTIISLIKNPLLISSLIGITLGIFKIQLPYTVFEFTRILGNAGVTYGTFACRLCT